MHDFPWAFLSLSEASMQFDTVLQYAIRSMCIIMHCIMYMHLNALPDNIFINPDGTNIVELVSGSS